MPRFSNPTDIAREAFRLLATRRIVPTPENYQSLYHEVAEDSPGEANTPSDRFPEEILKALSHALPKQSPAQLRLARELDQAIKTEKLPNFTASLATFIEERGVIERLGWGELIDELLVEWEARFTNIPQTQKRDALDHLFASAGNNGEVLYSRLQNVVRSWRQNGQIIPDTPSSATTSASQSADGTPTDSTIVDSSPQSLAPTDQSHDTGAFARATSTAPVSRAGELLPHLRDTLAFALEHAVAIHIAEVPELALHAKALATATRTANSIKDFDELLADLKRFAFRLEIFANDRTAMRSGLLRLLDLLIENIGELVVDDNWLHGQIIILHEIVSQPLSLRSIDDAERRIKDVIFKQSQLKHSLTGAQKTLKTTLVGFVEQLTDFSYSTSHFHDNMEICAQKIGMANNIYDLADVVQELMQETLIVQLSAQRSRDELLETRKQVEETEKKIDELRLELDNTSNQLRLDQLTGTSSRYGLDEAFAKESARAVTRSTPLCIAMIDIDNFKQLNDVLGHDAGDAALVHMANIIRDTLRPQDTVARIGGEEFVILLPETDLQAGVIALQRLQRELTKHFFLHDNRKRLITFSAGISLLRPGETQTEAIKRADEGMYEAKRSGKNRVIPKE